MPALNGHVKTNTERFGQYKNSDLTAEEYDTLFIQSGWNPKLLTNEANLMKTKWFDYRHMHFVEATYLFSMYYSRAYSDMMVKIFNHDSGRFMKGFKGGDFLELSSREKIGFWKARVVADSLGIPYGFYCKAAVRWCVEERIWKRVPRPNQLFSKDLVEAVNEAWVERCNTSLQIPIDERFELRMGTNTRLQGEFQEWLCGQIMNRRYPEIALHSYMVNRPMISVAKATEFMGKELVDEVISKLSRKISH